MNAVGIKRLLYADPSKVTGDLTPAMLKSILEDAETEEVTNVHQDTCQWTNRKHRLRDTTIS